jgi:hypothetical protein
MSSTKAAVPPRLPELSICTPCRRGPLNVRCPARFFVFYYHHVIGFGELTNDRHYDYSLAKQGFDPFLDAIMERDDPWPSRGVLGP